MRGGGVCLAALVVSVFVVVSYRYIFCVVDFAEITFVAFVVLRCVFVVIVLGVVRVVSHFVVWLSVLFSLLCCWWWWLRCGWRCRFGVGVVQLLVSCLTVVVVD